MDDTTILRVLAFFHPAWMLIGLAMAITTVRLGLEIRKRRKSGRSVPRTLRDRHLWFGRRTLALIGIGFVLGPLSMFFLRGREAFDSFHGILGIIVASLFAFTGWTGRNLLRGDAEARDLHRIAAAASLAAALLSAVAGFILLP
jgi:hypothetical protein